MKKFKITDYSDVPAYLLKQEEIADKRFFGLKRLEENFNNVLAKWHVVNDSNGKWVLASEADGLNGGLWYTQYFVHADGRKEMEAAEKAIADYCDSIRPELMEIKKIHPDGHMFSSSIEMAYAFLTIARQKKTYNFKTI
jgi:hypothetical protein